ncbi:MAG: hydrolase [Actinobacteria bacterium HGW-Actinobacteria-2]|nr:MAG: hydrolase [Actinobacteria bacterium HGW-Actinobacteria-2]
MPSILKPLAIAAAVVVLISGCVPAPGSTSTPGGSATSVMVGDVPVSAVPADGVDRRTFPAVSPTVPGLVAGLPGGDLAPYVAQEPTWKDCDGDQCATVLAPLDYADPASRAVTLALRVHKATKTPHLGPLFINPGGPGGSGVELVPNFDTEGLEQYDIVGWDPRGAGQSTPVRCLSDADTDALLNLDSSPDNDAERVALVEASLNFSRSCWERNGDLLSHIGTVDTVRDLDLLRQLFGAKKLNFLGYSYGTQIGATYAQVFGKNTGHLVLDSAVNITDDESVIQAQGFDLALGNFASWCAETRCGLGETKTAVLAAVTGLFDKLETNPLKVGNRTLTQSLAVTGVATALYSGKEVYPALSAIIQRTIAGNGTNLLYAADQLNFRDQSGHYDTMFYAFPAISCSETKEKGVLDADQTWADDQKKAPIFGKYFGPGYTCSLWGVPQGEYLKLHLTGPDAAPILVVGATGDSATPVEFARSMAKQLTSARLLIFDGEGHGSYGGNSTCIDSAVVKYLVAGTLPAKGTVCK